MNKLYCKPLFIYHSYSLQLWNAVTEVHPSSRTHSPVKVHQGELDATLHRRCHQWKPRDWTR